MTFPRPWPPRVRPSWAWTVIGLAILIGGCQDTSITRPRPAPPTALYVMNGLGETLSRIDLATGSVENDILPVGAVPNGLLFDRDLDRLFVANSHDNTVWSLQPDSLGRNGIYDLGPGSNPYAIVITASKELAVSNFLSGDVAFFDPGTAGLKRRVTVGRTPESLLSLPGRTLVTLVHYDFPSSSYGTGEVVSIPDGAAQAGDRVAVGLNPQDLLVGPDGLLHVVCTGNYQDVAGRIFFLDPGTLAPVDSLDLGGTVDGPSTPANALAAGGDVYVSAYSGGLMKYDGTSHAILRGPDHPVLDAPGLGGLAWDESRGRLYVTGFEEDLVYVVDTAADTLVTAIAVGNGPLDVALVAR